MEHKWRYFEIAFLEFNLNSESIKTDFVTVHVADLVVHNQYMLFQKS